MRYLSRGVSTVTKVSATVPDPVPFCVSSRLVPISDACLFLWT